MDNLPYTKKSLGQHWLTDQTSLRAMCEAAEVSASDVILEIGPGGGTLTKLLLECASQVVAVELDERLAVGLPSVVGGSAALTVVQQSILEFDLTTLPEGYKVVANIPYYLTSNLIRVLSESQNHPTIAVLLVQKEVAERVAADPGDMSLLSVSAQYYWEVHKGMVVPAKLFTPPPKVDSQILVLKRRSTPLFDDVDEKVFFRLVRIGYAQRRKTILNTLSSGLHMSKAEASSLCDAAHLSPTLRPQMLSLQDWHSLYAAYQALDSPAN
jgi:16S rRNA (adenine1518-N6/adenine1519-N6)-dimethyltransferase